MRFLSYVLQHSGLNDVRNRNDLPLVTQSIIDNVQIVWPENIEEQTAIADVISDVDALIASLNKLIAKKRDIKQATMRQLLTGKKRLPAFRGELEEVTLSELALDFIVPMRDKPKYFRGNTPWCRIEDFNGKYLYGSKSNQNVDNDIINKMNLKVFPIGTLLVSCSADSGRCAIVGRPLVTNQTFIGIIFDERKASNEFFYYYLSFYSDELNNLASGTTISYLSREKFESFKVRVPTKKEQTTIVEILSDMDAEIAALEQKRDKTQALKQGMMQELLTGKTRLI